MRTAASGGVALMLLATSAHAETLEINQSAWLNYTVIVNAMNKGSSLSINHRGEKNGISSVQITGDKDAEIWAHQRGRRNAAVLHQQGWITSSIVVQEGPHGPGGYRDLPMSYSVPRDGRRLPLVFPDRGFQPRHADRPQSHMDQPVRPLTLRGRPCANSGAPRFRIRVSGSEKKRRRAGFS